MKALKYIAVLMLIVAAAKCSTPEAGVKQVELDMGVRGNIER